MKVDGHRGPGRGDGRLLRERNAREPARSRTTAVAEESRTLMDADFGGKRNERGHREIDEQTGAERDRTTNDFFS